MSNPLPGLVRNSAAVALLAFLLSACSGTKTAKAVVTGPLEPPAREATFTVEISQNDELVVDGVVLSMNDLVNKLVLERTLNPDLSVDIRPHKSSSNLVLVQTLDAVRRTGSRKVFIRDYISDESDSEERP